MMNKSYTALMLLKDLKLKLQKIILSNNNCNEVLSYRKLSEILNKTPNLAYRIKKNSKRNPNFQLSLEDLEVFKSNLLCKFLKKCDNAILLIEKYQNLNNLRRTNERIYKFHPNIKLDYFLHINNKEKAYWLGFLYADGYITKLRNNFRLGLEINKDDEIILDQFCETLGINPKNIKYYKKSNTVRIRITNDKIGYTLIKNRFIVGNTKSKNIELPVLKSRGLYLAFLLGYFDGDGTTGTSRITSGSIKFLLQISKKFNIKNKIYSYKGNYKLYLGAKLFNEMLDNYQNSFSKKRIRLKCRKN